MSATGEADGRTKCRFDFAFVCLDEESHQVLAEPDPRRYERVAKDGEPFLLDKYLRVLIPFDEIVSGLDGLPTFASPRTISSAPDYALKRRQAVEREIETGEYLPPAEIPKHHEPFSADVRDVAFLSVDICGATSRRAINPEGFDAAFRMFVRELGTLVGQFHGTVLKTTGDGFIAYVDLPAFTIETDTAVDLSLSMVLMVKDTINPALEKLGQPAMAVRIGVDYGPAKLEKLWIAATEFTHADLVSDALNRAVKIEETCGANEIRIGRSLYELLHVQWLERCEEVSFDGSQVGIDGYRVYRVR
jgi:class 3 adenylate cyclase